MTSWIAILAGSAVLPPVPATSAQADGSVDTRMAQARARRASAPEPGRRALPHANGREFRTLDAYLAHLRDHAGPTDRPWYREVEPGLYRLERGNYRGDAPPRLFTRDELERRFGFRR